MVELIQVCIPGTGTVGLNRDDAKKLYESLRPLFSRKPRTPMGDADRAVDLYARYRKRYPEDNENRTVSRVTSHFPAPRPSNDQVRAWLRDAGFDIAEPWSPAECAKMARSGRKPGRRIPNPPDGYKVIDPAVWEANAPLFSHAEIRELASGGLAKIGLAIGTSEGDDWEAA